MGVVRVIAGVVVGYLAFAVGSMMLVGPATPPTAAGWALTSVLGLGGIGLVSGEICRWLAGPRHRLASRILAALVAAATLANLLLDLGAEPWWFKLAILLLTVPIILWTGIRGPYRRGIDLGAGEGTGG